MKLKLIFIFFSIAFFNLYLSATESIWKSVNSDSIDLKSHIKQNLTSNKYSVFHLSVDKLKKTLNASYNPKKSLAFQETRLLNIPMPDGDLQRFQVFEFPIMHPDLSKKFPNIKAYTGIGLDNTSLKIRFDLTPSGFHGIITSDENNTIFIDPYSKNNNEQYISYNSKDYQKDFSSKCYTDDEIISNEFSSEKLTTNAIENSGLRKYRIAIACTGEYSQFQGGTKESVLAAIHTTMTRVNAIYEREASIHLELIAENDKIIFLDPEADPYNFNFPYENQTVCDSIIGSENYDLGHVFGIGEGGSAMRSGCCVDEIKADAYSTFTQPEGDIFDVNFVAHEIGHQFGCGHTYSGSCNSTKATSFEPGAASTIMGTDFFCNKIQNVRDGYFHAINLLEIEMNLKEGLASSCAEIIETGNNAPTVEVKKEHYYLTISTNFKLSAVGNDIDGDILTYCWEQMDNETNVDPPIPTNSNGPAFRSQSPSEDPFRYFPALDFILDGEFSKWEVLPSVSREMKFRVTVRDNNPLGGRTASDDLSLSFVSNSGPFLLEFPNGDESFYKNGVYTISWDKANTDKAPVSCNKVNILLSVDGGYNYDYVLASEVPNDGSHIVQIPDIEANNARIMVKSSDNIFFDISDNDFEIKEQNQESLNFAVSPETQNICTANSSATFSLQFNELNSINLSLNNLPEGVVGDFSDNIDLENNSVDLIINNIDILEEGVYYFNVIAEAGSIVQEKEISIVVNNFQEDIELISPINGSKDQYTKPVFEWESPTKKGFILEIASTPDFNNSLVEKHYVNSNTFSTHRNLEALSVYYWRVINQTDCDYSSLNIPFSSFQTSSNSCIDIAFNKSLFIHNYIDEASSTFKVEDDIEIDKLNISMLFFHKNVGDLSATLTSPEGTSALLFDRPGYPEFPFGCTRDDLLVKFDDNSSNSSDDFENTCVTGTDYAIEGTFNSITPLSIFEGENAKGIWSIKLRDDKFQHAGALDNWSLQFCDSKIFEESLEFFKENIPVENLDSVVISEQYLLANSNNNNPEDIIYTIISSPKEGLLSLAGIDLEIGSTFTQKDINNGLLKYRHLNDSETKDQFFIDIKTNAGDWSPSEKISINGGLTSFDNGLSESSNINIYPNPSSEYIYFDFGHPIDYIIIYNTNSVEVLRSKSKTINIQDLANGKYFIRIHSNGKYYTSDFIKK